MPVRMRPRFEVEAPASAEAVARRLDAAIGRADAPCRGRRLGAHAVLDVPAADERVWSPSLSLDLVGHGDRTLVRGRFGPKPSVWTLFMAAYAVSAFAALFGGGFGLVQWGLGQAPWAGLVVPAAAALAGATYASARYGQRRGQGQMDALRRVLDDAIAAA